MCAELGPQGRADLQALAEMRVYSRNEMLCEQDLPLRNVLIVAEGIVKLFKIQADGQFQVIGFLGAGDHLGNLKRAEPMNMSAQAVTDVVACIIDQQEFTRFLRDHPDFAVGMLVGATDEIEALHDHIVLLGRKRARERLAAFLLMVGDRWQDGGGAKTVKLPMTRTDIANYLGLTPESLSRCFRVLKQDGVIEVPEPHSVTFRNLPALYHMAGFHELPSREISVGR